MKAIKMMFFVAAATMLFAACGKDEDGSTPSNLANNQLSYDGTTYDMICSVFTDGSTYVQFYGNGTTADFGLEGMFNDASFNKTVNVAVHNPNQHYYVTAFSQNLFSFSYDNWDEGIHGGIGDQRYENESIFSEGTMTNTLDENGFSLSLNGTLKNGKKIAFKIYVPAEDFLSDER